MACASPASNEGFASLRNTHLGDDWSVNRSGTEHIDADAAPLEFQRPASCKCLDRRLAARIDCMPLKHLVARDRAGEDNRSAVTEQRRDLLHTEEDTPRVGRELRVELVSANLVRRRDDDHAGIGEIDVQSTKLLPNLANNMIMMREIGDIAPDCKSLMADLCNGCVQSVLAFAR